MSLRVAVLAKIKFFAREVLLVAAATYLASLAYQHLNKRLTPTRSNATETNSQAADSTAVGDIVRIKGATFSTSQISVILVTSPSCPFCLQSARFHASVLTACRSASVPMYILVPGLDNSQSYLHSNGLSGAVVKDWTEAAPSFRGTPTLLIVDAHGVVKRLWAGLLSSQRERDVLKLIADPSAIQKHLPSLDTGEANLTRAELSLLAKQRNIRIIDINERHRRTDTSVTKIPLPELELRAPSELVVSDLQVLDCSATPRDRCALAIDKLVAMEYKVAVLNAGTYFENICGQTNHDSALINTLFTRLRATQAFIRTLESLQT